LIAYGISQANLMGIIGEVNSSNDITGFSKKANDENKWIKGKLERLLLSNPFIKDNKEVFEKVNECIAIIDNGNVQVENLQKNKRNSMKRRSSLKEVKDMENLQLFKEDT